MDASYASRFLGSCRGAPVPPQSHEMRTAEHIVDALASQYTVLRERVPMEFCVQVDVSAPRLCMVAEVVKVIPQERIL